MTSIRRSTPQQGIALVVGMVMLVVLTLLVLSAATLSTSNVKATSNLQFRDAALAAANVAIEQVASTKFFDLPIDTLVQVDIDRDGTDDYQVTVPKPACTYWRPIPNKDLDVTADVSCFAGSGAGSGGKGAPTPSLCATTHWAVRAPVGDPTTGALVTVNQGIGVRLGRTIAETACNK